jgi:hypothetical protein
MKSSKSLSTTRVNYANETNKFGEELQVFTSMITVDKELVDSLNQYSIALGQSSKLDKDYSVGIFFTVTVDVHLSFL